MRVVCIGIGVLLFGALLLACETSRGERITIHTNEPPALVAYREDACDQWHPVDADGASFEIELSGPYHAIIVCDDHAGPQRRVNIAEFARTPEDGAIDFQCGRARPLTVKLPLTEFATVFLGAAASTNGPGSTIQLRAAPGTYDLIALPGNRWEGYQQIAIRHDARVDIDLTLFDPTAGAQPTIATEFTAINALPEEIFSSSVAITSGNTKALVPGQNWVARFAPETLLAPDGKQTVSLSTLVTQGDSRGQARRVSRTWRPGLSTAVTLPPLMGPATLVNDGPRLVATWSSLPIYDRLELERDHLDGAIFEGVIVHQSLVLSRAFVEQVGITSATLDPSEVPGFLPDWAIADETTEIRSFNVIHGDARDFEETAIGDSKIISGG